MFDYFARVTASQQRLGKRAGDFPQQRRFNGKARQARARREASTSRGSARTVRRRLYPIPRLTCDALPNSAAVVRYETTAAGEVWTSYCGGGRKECRAHQMGTLRADLKN